MLRRLGKLAIVAFALMAAFSAGVVLGARNGWLQPIVTVTVVNQTGQPLTQLHVVYTSTRVSGTVELPSLASGERAVARFHVSTEASYKLKGLQADGKAVHAQEAYVEPGYSMTEVLTSEGSSSSMQYEASGG